MQKPSVILLLTFHCSRLPADLWRPFSGTLKFYHTVYYMAASNLYPHRAKKGGKNLTFFLEKEMKNRCFGAFLQSIPGEEGLELSGIYGLLLVRAGPRVSAERKVSGRQNFSFA